MWTISKVKSGHGAVFRSSNPLHESNTMAGTRKTRSKSAKAPKSCKPVKVTCSVGVSKAKSTSKGRKVDRTQPVESATKASKKSGDVASQPIDLSSEDANDYDFIPLGSVEWSPSEYDGSVDYDLPSDQDGGREIGLLIRAIINIEDSWAAADRAIDCPSEVRLRVQSTFNNFTTALHIFIGRAVSKAKAEQDCESVDAHLFRQTRTEHSPHNVRPNMGSFGTARGRAAKKGAGQTTFGWGNARPTTQEEMEEVIKKTGSIFKAAPLWTSWFPDLPEFAKKSSGQDEW